MTDTSTGRNWLIIPAAGIGKRMASEIPKQYLELGRQPVIQLCIEKLARSIQFEAVVVALADNDTCFDTISFDAAIHIHKVAGGAERADSVMSGLNWLVGRADAMDWVWVHDAARPCVRSDDLVKLAERIRQHDVGGILGMPVRDTMKQVEQGHISKTLDRSQIWHAFTPQVFRFARLRKAMQQAQAAGLAITDEASAIEHSGAAPLIVAGHSDNIKITHPADLQLAEYYLEHQ